MNHQMTKLVLSGDMPKNSHENIQYGISNKCKKGSKLQKGVRVYPAECGQLSSQEGLDDTLKQRAGDK